MTRARTLTLTLTLTRYELGTPAYPDPTHDKTHQLPLTAEALMLIATTVQHKALGWRPLILALPLILTLPLTLTQTPTLTPTPTLPLTPILI